MGHGRRQKPQTGDQHGHHEGAQTARRSNDNRFMDGVAARAQLVDVFDHDYTGLHGYTKQGEKSHTGGHAKVLSSQQQCDQSSDRSQSEIQEDKKSPLERAEHGVKHQHDYKNRERNHDREPTIGTFLAFVFAGPFKGVTLRQFYFAVNLLHGLFYSAAEVAASDAVLDGDVTLIPFPVDH